MSASTKWYYSPEPWRMGSGNLEGLLESSLDLLTQLQIRVPAHGRHRRALARLAAANRAAELDRVLPPTDREGLEFAHRTAWETVIICVAAFRYRRRSTTTPFTCERLHALMDGAETYGTERSHARDIQFELFIAAQLVLGSLDVFDGEPDLQFRYGPERVGVAAKRLASLEPSQVRRNIKKAADQIAASGMRGWIALNLDSKFYGVPVHGRRQDLLKRFAAAFDSVNPIAAEFTVRKDVLGVLAYGHLSGWRTRRAARPELIIRAPFRWLCWEGDEPGATLLFDDFSRGWRPRVSSAIEAIMRGDIRSVV